MKKQLQQIHNKKTSNRIMPVLFVLTLMLAPQFCGAQTGYITNFGDNTVSVIDVTRNIVTATIPVGANPWGISVSPDGSAVYVADFYDGLVSVINTASNAVSGTFYGGSFPAGIFASSNGNLYVVNGNYINVINTFGYTIDTTIEVGSNPYGICQNLYQGKIYVANYGDATVSVIDVATDSVSAAITVGANPIALAVSPDGSMLYVANAGDGTVSVINTTTNIVSATIHVGSTPSAIAVNPDGTKIYVANHGGYLNVINTVTNTVSSAIYFSNYNSNTQPVGVSVSPDGTEVYVADQGANSVFVINTTTNTVSSTIAVGRQPVSFGNFISTYSAPCGASFAIAADTTQLHHYIVTNNSFGKLPIKYVWSWGDSSPDDTIPYPSHTYSDSGFYTICLSITDSTGCQSTFCDNSFHALRTTNTMVYISVFNPLTTGTQAINSPTPLVLLYPNPATSQLNISFHNEAPTVLIMNMLGQTISQSTITNPQSAINISFLPAGIYFLQIKSESGSMVKRFVKE